MKLVCLAGECIGPEVTAVAARVLRELALEVELEGHSFGAAAITAVGDPLPAATLEACRRADAVLALGLLVAGHPWPALRGLRVDEITAMARLSSGDQRGGLEALKTSYGWRQDRWMILARGCGAFAVALVLALVRATLQADRVIVERSLDASARGGASAGKRTTTESRTSPEAFALAGVVLLVAVGAWGERGRSSASTPVTSGE